MNELDRSSPSTPFLVDPRWPYAKVHVSSEALRCLATAQHVLAEHGLMLVLTRGYESRGRLIRLAHRLARIAGMALFGLVYPHRSHEIRAIFSPNGHDRTGDCIDVGIARDGQTLVLLPLGVFTPRWLIQRRRHRYQRELAQAWSALESAGFTIHANLTEAMQIHCEASQ